MKKKYVFASMILLCTLLAGCCTEHSWQEATCTAPKTCSNCQKTEGDPLPHTWEEATCLAPKTCRVCQATEGEAGDHKWADATCTTPKTCTLCAAAEGEPVPHDWAEATMVLPKTCKVCAVTDGTANNYFAVNGIPVEDYLPSEFGSIATVWLNGNKSNQEQVDVHFTDVNFYIPTKDDGITKEVAPRFRAKFVAPSNANGFWLDFNVFDLYTGQVIPFRDEDDYTVTINVDGKDIPIRVQGWDMSDWFNFTSEGIDAERYVWANLYVPKEYDGLVLAIGNLKYYGHDDTEFKEREFNGMMAGDYFQYSDYYEGVTFYRLVPDPQNVS